MSQDPWGIMHWFGASWGAPINESCPRTEIPIGLLCARCENAFGPDDHGLMLCASFIVASLPEYGREPKDYIVTLDNGLPYEGHHLDCFIAELGLTELVRGKP